VIYSILLVSLNTDAKAGWINTSDGRPRNSYIIILGNSLATDDLEDRDVYVKIRLGRNDFGMQMKWTGSGSGHIRVSFK
jgi:hypothetical protein